MFFVTIVVQLIAALAVAGVVMTALGFGTPIHSKLLVLALTAVPVGFAVWIVGRLLDRGCSWRALAGAIVGGAIGYGLIELEAPHKLMQLMPGVDSFWWFTAASCLPATLGYWIARGKSE